MGCLPRRMRKVSFKDSWIKGGWKPSQHPKPARGKVSVGRT